MTSDEFDALLARRDVLAHSHDLACKILAEEGESRLTRDTCLRTYFELEEAESLIRSECEAERLAEEASRDDWATNCRCEQCGPRGPFTCIGGKDD